MFVPVIRLLFEICPCNTCMQGEPVDEVVDGQSRWEESCSYDCLHFSSIFGNWWDAQHTSLCHLCKQYCQCSSGQLRRSWQGNQLMVLSAVIRIPHVIAAALTICEWTEPLSDCAQVTKGNRTLERRESIPSDQVGRAEYWSRSVSEFRHCKHPAVISNEKGPAFKPETQVEGEDTGRVEGNGKVLFQRFDGIKQRAGKRAIRIKCVRELPGHILLLNLSLSLSLCVIILSATRKSTWIPFLLLGRAHTNQVVNLANWNQTLNPRTTQAVLNPQNDGSELSLQ